MSESTNEAEVSAAAKSEGNKKQSKRVNVRVPIRISTIDPEKDPETGRLYFYTSEEYSANISRSGAFVNTPEPIDPGRRVLVEIDIPNGSSIQTVGQVVWKQVAPSTSETTGIRKPGVGIKFTGGRPELMNELDRYISKASRRRTDSAQPGPSSQPTT
jgi:Tfp pilus assembly protein PilZ